MLKGVGNLTKDALTFKWAQATMKDVAVNTVVHRDCLLVLHWRVHRQGQFGWLPSLAFEEQMLCSRVLKCENKENSVTRFWSYDNQMMRPCKEDKALLAMIIK